MLILPTGGDPFDHELQLSQLRWVATSRAAATGLAAASVDTPPAAVGDLAELLDIDVEQLTRPGPLIPLIGGAPAHQLPGEPVEICQQRHLPAAQHRPDSGRRQPQ